MEQLTFITGDGVKLRLHAPPTKVVISEEGMGMPPIEYVSQRGVRQHGETYRDYFLKPRVIQVIVRHNFNCRMDYWRGRANLLNHLRPNRNGPCLGGVLRKTLDDGTKRDFRVVIEEGPNFQPRDRERWDEWSYEETLRFIAHNPIAFDPVQRVVDLTPATDTTGTFPMTFPVVFGSTPTALTGVTVAYLGNWDEYPDIVAYGPMTAFGITNVTTGEFVAYQHAIPAGDYVLIHLTYGEKSVSDAAGNDLIGYISEDSDLAAFHLRPGNNVIRLDIVGAGIGTRVAMSYYNRYIGI